MACILVSSRSQRSVGMKDNSRNQSFRTDLQQLFRLLIRIHLDVAVVEPSFLSFVGTNALSEKLERYPGPLDEWAETSKVCGDTSIVVLMCSGGLRCIAGALEMISCG